MGQPKNLKQALPIFRRMWRHFWPYLRNERPMILFSMLALFAEIAFRLLEPWPLKFVFDRVIQVKHHSHLAHIRLMDGMSSTKLLLILAIALVVFTALRAMADYFNTISSAIIGNRVLTKVRFALYRHLQCLSLSFHNKARGGDLTVRVTSDISMLKDVVVTALLPLVASALIMVAMVALMFWLQWKLTLLALLPIPLLWLSTIRLSRRIHEAAISQRQREGALASTTAESISAIKVVQALSLEQTFATFFSRQNLKSQKQDVLGRRLSARLERTVDLHIAVSTALVLFYGAQLVLNKVLTAGDLLVFLTYLKRAFNPLQDFAKYTGRLAKASAAGERIADLLEREPEVMDLPDAVEAPPFQGRVEFQDVVFGYDPSFPVLKGIDFQLEPGEHVAIVGPSGIGKSTLASLILRLYDPQEGSIKIDGSDIRAYKLESLRSQISVVLQDSILFAASLWENIAYGAMNVTEEEIAAASRLANAHDFITALPQGYDTVVGERGVTLSHGQRQRIAIARAAVRRAPILIFDEPTVGLDEENERTVIDALQKLAIGRTAFVITHHLSLASTADCILHLESGTILEQGSHQELLQLNGRYAALFQMQKGVEDARPS
jgi:ABC-type multidrug transport system, ATPase and permease components